MSVLSLLILGVVAFCNIALGFLVLQRAYNNRSNQAFFAFVMSLTAWTITNFLTDNVQNLTISLWSARFANFFAILSVATFWIFTGIFATQRKSSFIKRVLLISSPALVISLTPLGIQNVTSVTSAANQIIGPLYFVVVATLIIAFIAGILDLVRGYRHTTDKYKRKSLLLMIYGTALTFAFAVVTNIFLPIAFDSWDISRLGPIFTLILTTVVAYGIIRHRLFDVRPVISRVIAYSTSLLVIVFIYSIGAFLVATNILDANIESKEVIIFALFSVIVALLFQPLKRFFDKVTNKVFYQEAYDSQEVINTVNSVLVTTLNLEYLLSSTSKIIEKEVKATYVDFYLAQKASIEFHLAGSNTRIFASDEWAKLAEALSENDEKIISLTQEDLDKTFAENMHSLNIECVIRMMANNENVGFLIIGPKKNGNAFSNQDLRLFEIIADEVAIAVQNALRFEEISQFNVTLQQKIDDATRLLQKSNEKLKALDEAKDEFISMASHQLRTPLTSVKGYLSMLMEGDAGPINDQQKTFLDQAFLSSQRMVYLIADLLNVSRLKTGKFLIETGPTYLPDVVESEIAQLHETAKARGLKMVFHKPDSFPTLNLDETKIRQVIMNFADNAIYYTPHGGKITLNLKENDQSIEFTVHDTGIGVPKSEQHHLFTKFYRAGNAKKARPDGTGLGLFMAKKVVVAQGGAIIFNTEEGKGSTFGFSFPRERVEIDQDNKDKEPDKS